MIALGSLFSAMATLNSGGLFPLAMKLLDLPAYRCLLSDCGGRSFRKIVGDDLFRVSGRGNQPEQFDLMALGKFLEVNEFTTFRSHRRVEYPVVGRAFPGPVLLVGSA